jgi:hypothetical protein
MDVSRVCQAAVWIGALLVGELACRAALPRPDQLELGTFVADLDGVAYTSRDTVRIAERVEGIACRLADFVLLDSRDFSRRFVFFFPSIATPVARYPLGLRTRATAHLNHGPLMDRGGFTSLSAVGGYVDLVAVSSGDIRGELRVRLAQAVSTGRRPDDVVADTTGGVVALVGSFRADTRRGERCGHPT